jgi:putative addiction module component (TIGR02574 family)
MKATLDKVAHDALEMPEQDRAHLAHALILSMDDSGDDDVSTAWDAEIERRVNDIRSGKVKGIPAEEVFAKLRDKYH